VGFGNNNVHSVTDGSQGSADDNVDDFGMHRDVMMMAMKMTPQKC
jgi:hypothetical protein